MGNPTKEATEMANKKSPAFLKAIAFIAALVVVGLLLLFVEGISKVSNTSFLVISTWLLYAANFIYAFRSIRKQQKD